MKLPRIFSNRQFQWVTFAVTAIAALTLILNLFVIGGDLFIFNFNSSLNFPLAFINAIASVSVWQLMSAKNSSRFMWTGIVAGWSLWALAEAVWGAYALMGGEVPFPSAADFFWVCGYIPMGVGLITRIQSVPTKPTRSQNIFIWSVSAATILIALFAIFIPIVQDFDPALLLESVLSLTYPAFDLFLVVIVWRLFFTYEEGDYGFAWRLLTLGFFLNTASDFLFIYADWNGIYYPAPEMTANALSRAADVSYIVSYLIWFMSVYAFGVLLRKKTVVIEQAPKVRVVRTYGHVLLYTKNDDTIMETSANFGRLFNEDGAVGKSLADVVGLSEQGGLAIMEKLRSEGRVADLPLQVRNRSGVTQEVRLSGVAILNAQKGYLGSNLLLRLRVTDPAFDDILDQPSKAMAKYLLNQSGSANKAEVAQFLLDYYLAFIKALFNMAAHESGATSGEALLDELRKAAQERNWQMQFNPQAIVEYNDYPLELLREALPVLLETAKGFVSNLTEPANVEARMTEVASQFNETVRRDVARFSQSGSEVGFSNHRKEISAQAEVA